MQTFANVTHELPKFAQEDGDNKKWWTKRSGYNTKQDMIVSAKELNLKKMMCGSGAKPEAMVITDHLNELPPKDPFKQVHVPKPPKSTGKEPCTDKPTQAKLASNEEVDYQPPANIVELQQQQEEKYSMNHRWSTFEMQFSRGELKVKRFFDKLPKAKLRPGDVNPVFSSFNPQGIYRQSSVESGLGKSVVTAAAAEKVLVSKFADPTHDYSGEGTV